MSDVANLREEHAHLLKLVRRLGFTVKSFPEDPDFKLVTYML